MTLSLWHLHAATALCDLARAWPLLRATAGAIHTQASDGLRSPLYGRISAGGHGDGGILRAVESGHDEQARWVLILERVAEQVRHALWIALSVTPGARVTTGPGDELHVTRIDSSTWHAITARRGGAGYLAGIATALPRCSPSSARDIAGYLAGADRVARAALQLDADRHPLVGVPCPACDTRLLETATASPHRAAWTVTCAAGCRCTGPRCLCADTGTGPADGAPHIWRWTVIAARTLAPAQAAA